MLNCHSALEEGTGKLSHTLPYQEASFPHLRVGDAFVMKQPLNECFLFNASSVFGLHSFYDIQVSILWYSFNTFLF